jgi:hypothetical protein
MTYMAFKDKMIIIDGQNLQHQQQLNQGIEWEVELTYVSHHWPVDGRMSDRMFLGLSSAYSGYP